jgi:hypothetical protein
LGKVAKEEKRILGGGSKNGQVAEGQGQRAREAGGENKSERARESERARLGTRLAK